MSKIVSRSVVVVLLTAILSFSVYSPSAHAGIVLTIAGSKVEEAGNTTAGKALLFTGLGAAMVGVIGTTIVWSGTPALIFAGVFLLDADGRVEQNFSAPVLTSNFPFLADQPEAVADLAAALATQVEAAGSTAFATGTQTTVSLPEASVRDILNQTNLSNEQVQLVVDALK